MGTRCPYGFGSLEEPPIHGRPLRGISTRLFCRCRGKHPLAFWNHSSLDAIPLQAQGTWWQGTLTWLRERHCNTDIHVLFGLFDVLVIAIRGHPLLGTSTKLALRCLP